MKVGSCAIEICESGQALTGAALNRTLYVPQGSLAGAGCLVLTWLVVHKGGLHSLFYILYQSMKKTIMLIATGLGTGYLPISGTMASVLAILLYLPFSFLNTSRNFLIFFYMAFTFILTGLSIWTAAFAEIQLKEKDPHKVVIDEIAGYFYAMILLPTKPWILLSSFVLFRLFDIWKPFPIMQSQKLPGGVGITVDDILAGLYTCVILHIVLGIIH